MRRAFLLPLALVAAQCAFAQSPVIDHIAPTSAIVGNAGFTIFVSGYGFPGGATVYWNGAPLTTTFISSSQLSASVPTANLSAVGPVQVIVGGNTGSSNGVVFRVISPLAQVTSYSPTIFAVNVDTPITVYGSGFMSNAVIYFDWLAESTTFVSSSQLIGTISRFHITTGGPHSIRVINGVPAAPTKCLSVAPQTIDFGNQTVGATSSTLTATLTNICSGTVTFSGFTIGGVNATEFANPSTTCGATLAATFNCTASITVTPATLGLRLGIFSVASDSVGSPQSLNLKGNGTATPLISISLPNFADFGNVPNGVASASQTVTLTNTGLPNYVISSIAYGGANIADFDNTGTNCTATTYASSATCQFEETLTPSALGARVGTITITDNAPGSPRVLNLTGMGVQPGPNVNITPSSLAFGTITQSTTSSPAITTLTNNGTTNLTISAISVASSTYSADFAMVTGGTACSTSTILVPGGSCPISATFTPSTTSVESANISITDNAVGSPHLLPMAGTGAAAGAHHMDLSWTASSSGSVTGYNVYRGTTNGGPYSLLTPTPITGLTYTDNAVTSGVTYYYVITAVGTNPPYSPTESLNSAQGSATIP